MVKVFISQPMRGKTEEEILSKRNEAIEIVKKLYDNNVEIIDSFFAEAPTSENPAIWWLGKTIQVLSDANVAFFAKGWNDARGCKIENICAREYGIDVIEEDIDGEIKIHKSEK